MNSYPRKIFSDVGHFVAFGFGTGLSPIAPGTVGSLAAVPLYFALHSVLPASLLLPVIVSAFVFGVPICDRTGRWIGEADYQGIVWDEIVAMWAVIYCIPFTVVDVTIGFLAFRLFDIIKPWPISEVDSKLKNGFGVMLDDLLAAVPAVAIVWIIKTAFGA